MFYAIKEKLPLVFLILIVVLIAASSFLVVADRVNGGVDVKRAVSLLEPDPGYTTGDEGDTGDADGYPQYAAGDEQGEASTQSQPTVTSTGAAAGSEPVSQQTAAQAQAQSGAPAATTQAAAMSSGSDVPRRDAVFVFKGYGRAHGVGLCMDGVRYRALAGQSYLEIINYYYTGVTLTQVDEQRTIKVKGRDGQVRTLSMNEYLKHLVEEPEDYPAEGLKVLYVAARTYTLSCIARGKHAASKYDICSSGDCCQAFSETKDLSKYPNNIAAVDATAGQALYYEGSPITAAYCGSCGGHTDNNEDVWGGQALPYLRGKPDPYCASSPRFCAVTELSVSQLEGKLSSAGFGVGNLSLVDLSSRTPGGRVKVARLVGSGGTREISGLALAKLLGLSGTRFDYSFK